MRADRLLSLMLLLNARGRMTAQTLAQQLEVSERTIYRDVDALGAAGIPIYVQPGVNGGIFLDEHYRISLTGLSRAEALALFVSSSTPPLADLGREGAVEATLLKLFAALPLTHQAEVERLRSRFYIISTPPTGFKLSNLRLCCPCYSRPCGKTARCRSIIRWWKESGSMGRSTLMGWWRKPISGISWRKKAG